jgi:hypothetical protein
MSKGEFRRSSGSELYTARRKVNDRGKRHVSTSFLDQASLMSHERVSIGGKGGHVPSGTFGKYTASKGNGVKKKCNTLGMIFWSFRGSLIVVVGSSWTRPMR